jgi:hypothetical protein
LPGQPNVDEHTVALYHFDSPNGNSALDATGHYTGTLNGNAWITSVGQYAGALQVDGSGSYVRAGHLGDLSSGTLEAFIDFSTACDATADDFTIIAAGGEFGTHQKVLSLRVQTGLAFGIFANGKWNWADSGINPCRYLAGGYPPAGPLWPYEAWRFHHVAGTWGPRGLEIWVDGVLHGVGNDALNADIEPYPYKCNPQMQMGLPPSPPNDRYPLCKTPVMAPLMSTPYPPGDYTGGLPSYSTFLIGCDASGSCFRGRIDEVRVSNIQRTFEWTVVPTSTPTPTPTPERVTGEYTVDAFTFGLYHLSTLGSWKSVYNEATQQYDAGLGGQADLTASGRFNAGVALNGVVENGIGSHISTSHFGNPSTGTLEAWVNVSSATGQFTIFHAGGAVGVNVNRLFVGVHAPYNNLALGMDRGADMFSPDWVWVESNVNASRLVGSWHHVAATWGARGYELWLDGELCTSQGGFRRMPDPVDKLLIGCNPFNTCMHGTVDEVRISTIQRIFSPVALGVLPPPSANMPRFPSTPRAYGLGDSPFQLFFPFVSAAPSPTPRVPCGPLF